MTWAAIAEPKMLGPAQDLFVAGEAASYIYLLTEGCVQTLVARGETGVLVTSETTPGDVLGEAALLTDAVYPSSARALTQSTVLRLRGDTVDALLKEGGDFAAEFTLALTRRLSQVEDRATAMALGGLHRTARPTLVDRSTRAAHLPGPSATVAGHPTVIRPIEPSGPWFQRTKWTRPEVLQRLATVAGQSDSWAWYPLLKFLAGLGVSAAMCAELATAVRGVAQA